MALTVGELVAYATIDKSDFSSGTQAIGSDLSRLQSSTSSSMASMESTVTKSLSEIEQSIRDGLDPAAAIADLDRLERELDAGLQEMLDEADRFAAELDATIDEAFASLDDDAQQSGKKAGDELVDGLRAGCATPSASSARRARTRVTPSVTGLRGRVAAAAWPGSAATSLAG